MTHAVATPQSVHREIWESFVSVLRSYAGAAELSGKHYTVESFSDGARLEYQQRAVRFTLHADTGDATWREQQGNDETSGTFHINQDGTLGFADGPKAMDVAAIEWIEQLGQKENKL